MRILDMQTFTALVRNRHFGRTAQELSTTQPAISSRLAAQATTTLINNLMQARLDAQRAAGRTVIGIDLQLDRHVGLWQTSALPYLVEAGRRAATRQLPEIQAALERSAQRRAA